MTSPISDPVVAPIAANLILCLTAEAAKVPTPPSETPRIVCLRPGDHVDLLMSSTEDECCQGLMWVRFVRMYPSAQGKFPAQDGRVTPCDVMRWAVVFELGAVRCSPVGTTDELPTCDDWTDVTLNTYDDLAAIRRALCCYATSFTDRLIMQGIAEPLTTEGGCTGVSMLVTISGPSCDCQEASTL